MRFVELLEGDVVIQPCESDVTAVNYGGPVVEHVFTCNSVNGVSRLRDREDDTCVKVEALETLTADSDSSRAVPGSWSCGYRLGSR